jgi:hypothetical protein
VRIGGVEGDEKTRLLIMMMMMIQMDQDSHPSCWSCSETIAIFPILAKQVQEVLPASNLLACNLSRFRNWVQIAPLKWGTHSAEGM